VLVRCFSAYVLDRDPQFGVLSLHVYMGDFYGFDRYGNLVWFHGPLRPEGQAAFLKLWTDIGCRWEEAKPGYGQPFKVIGFWLSMDQGILCL
jgi:hypothetical protein